MLKVTYTCGHEVAVAESEIVPELCQRVGCKAPGKILDCIKLASIDTILEERGQRYGDFRSHATLSQHLKNVVRSAPNYHNLSADKQESIEMILHKIARIINGDPEYDDSWADISGYAELPRRYLKS